MVFGFTGKSIYKWMRAGATPILGNLHMIDGDSNSKKHEYLGLSGNGLCPYI
jgi:hypothetical protein